MKTLLLLIVWSCFSSAAFAEWVVLSPKESGTLIELDTIRSKKLINNHVAFARTYLNDQQIEIKTEINCFKKKHKLLFQLVSDNKGNKISESKDAKPWESIAPDSIFEVLRLKLCQDKHK